MSVLLEVPANALAFDEDGTLKTYQGELSIFTRLSQASGVVATQHRLYKLTGDLKRLPVFRQRPLSYFRTMSAPPGSYRLEIVVRDTVANRASTTELELVSEPGEAVFVGDLLMVRDVKRVKEKEALEHPFGWRRTIVTPHLGELLPATGQHPLLLAVPVVAGRPVLGRLALSSENGPLAEIPVSFEPPANDRSLMGFLELPTSQLPPGTYKVTLTVNAVAKAVVRHATFVVPPSKN